MSNIEVITLLVSTEDYGGSFHCMGLDHVIETLSSHMDSECTLLDWESEEVILTLNPESSNSIRERLHTLQEEKKPKAIKPVQAVKKVTKNE